MRVLYDGFNYFPPQGVARYFSNVIQRLPEDIEPALAATNLVRHQLPANPRLQTTFGYTIPSLRAYLRFPVLRRMAEAQLRRQIDLSDFQIVHPTYFQMLTTPSVRTVSCRLVITVYDMTHEKVPSIDPEGATARQKAEAIEAADRVLCISQNTRNDLLEIHPAAEDKTVVTPLASDITREMSFGSEPVPDAPYLLYVGGRSAYKNFDAVLELMVRLAEGHPEVVLAVVGPALSRGESRKIGAIGLGDRVREFDRPTDDHLAKLYRCSIALVYPSRYEGFGIPPLEAMTCGTPVIASNTSSIPEVVGDAGILLDPSDSHGLFDAANELIEGDGRDRMVRRGFERAGLFDWDRTAAQTVQVYRELTSSGE